MLLDYVLLWLTASFGKQSSLCSTQIWLKPELLIQEITWLPVWQSEVA